MALSKDGRSSVALDNTIDCTFLKFLYLPGFLPTSCGGNIGQARRPRRIDGGEIGTGFRQKLLTTKPLEALVATMVAAIPNPFHDRFDEIMDLYLASNEPGNEDKLDRILEEYFTEPEVVQTVQR